jgi:hypothetical protein
MNLLDNQINKETELGTVKTSNVVQVITNSNSNEESEGVKTSNFHIVGTSSNWDDHFNTVLNEACNRLLHSKSLADIVEVFKYAVRETGRAEIITARLLFYICDLVKEDKDYLPKRGYNSLSEFIDDLKGSGINNRTGFYNSVKAGQILSHPGLFSFSVAGTKITERVLYSNFSKIKYLFPIRRKIEWREEPFTYEDVMDHFLHDTCREFKKYMKGVQVRMDEVDIYRTKKAAAKQKKANKTKSDDRALQVIQPMNDKLMEIYHEIRKGHIVIFVPNINQEFLEAAKICIENRLKKRQDELNSRMENSSISISPTAFFKRLGELETLFLGTMVIGGHYSAPIFYSSPNTIKNIIRDNFKRKTDYELAKAFLINRLHCEPNLKEGLTRYSVTSVKDFAYNVLDIDESQYKRLKKIGANLKFIENFQGEIDLTVPGFLEKIYFLDKAITNHKNDRDLIIRNLAHLSAKQFREFARNSSYCPDNEPIVRRDYNKALLRYREYETLLEKHESVAIIGFYSQRQVASFNGIISTLETGRENFERWYPEIPWPYFDKRDANIA